MTTIARTLAVGIDVPPQVHVTDFAVWHRYAAVNDEFVPIHMDDDAGRAAGLPGAVGMGNLQWAYLHNVVRDWLGDEGRIVSMTCQFRSPNLRGQTVIAKAVVTAVAPNGPVWRADLDVWTEADGRRLAEGKCSVLVDRPAATESATESS